jgi:hypothetical protein
MATKNHESAQSHFLENINVELQWHFQNALVMEINKLPALIKF